MGFIGDPVDYGTTIGAAGGTILTSMSNKTPNTQLIEAITIFTSSIWFIITLLVVLTSLVIYVREKSLGKSSVTFNLIVWTMIRFFLKNPINTEYKTLISNVLYALYSMMIFCFIIYFNGLVGSEIKTKAAIRGIDSFEDLKRNLSILPTVLREDPSRDYLMSSDNKDYGHVQNRLNVLSYHKGKCGFDDCVLNDEANTQFKQNITNGNIAFIALQINCELIAKFMCNTSLSEEKVQFWISPEQFTTPLSLVYNKKLKHGLKEELNKL